MHYKFHSVIKFLSICFLLFSANCFSKPGLHNDVLSSNDTISNISIFKKNSIYLELFGNGIVYSFGYDRLILNRELFNISSNIGMSIIPQYTQSNNVNIIMYAITPQLNFLIGEKNKLELGLGYTMISLQNIDKDNILSYRIGYRHQKPEGGLFFRIGFIPFSFIKKSPDSFNNYLYFQPWGGIAIGWTF